jgi:hypothetical protein
MPVERWLHIDAAGLQCAQTFGYTAHLQQNDLIALRM